MLSCRHVTELCSQEQERRLTLHERLLMRMHLTVCVGCTRFRKQLNFLRRASQRFFRPPAGVPQSGSTPRE